MIHRLHRSILAAWVLIGAGCSAPPPDSVVLITIDTLRADRVGSYAVSGGRSLTPNLDRVASRGVLFEDATAPTPITLPSHASLLTGRYPNSTGVRNNGTFVLPEAETTLAEVLREAGWSTGAVVAAFPLHRRYGLAQGFEIYDDGFPKLESSGTAGAPVFFPERDATAVTDRAIEVWNRLGDGRKFLWVHYFDPHAPYAPPEPYRDRDPDHPYDGEVEYVDFEIGRLLGQLDLDPRSAVLLVTADHGEGLGDHDEKTHGVFLYQSTLRVPLILRAPGLPAGARVTEPVSLVDVTPTILGRVGHPLHVPFQGADLSDLVHDGTIPERPVYGETFLPLYDYRFSELRMLRDGPLKYIDAPEPELYDLDSDPGEAVNLAGAHPDETTLAGQLFDWVSGEDASVVDRASGSVDPEAIASLRSLGYLSGGPIEAPDSGERGRDPKSMTAYIASYDRAVGLLSMRRFDDAIRILRELEVETPENFMISFQIAGALLAAGRLEESADALGTVVGRAPQFAGGQLMLGEVRGMLGEVEASTRSYEAAIILEPWSAEPHFQMGRMLQSAGRFGSAGDAYLSAVSLEPSNPEFLAAYLDLWKSRGDLDRAVTGLEALSADTPYSSDLWVGLARAHRLNGKWDAARTALDRALELEPGHAEASLLSAVVTLESGDPERAERMFRDVMRIRPDSARAHLGLARSLASLGRPEEADAEFALALELRPDFAAVFAHRGRMLERLGDLENAATMYRRALAIDPTDGDTWAALQQLRPTKP